MQEKDKFLLALADVYELDRPNRYVGFDSQSHAEQESIAQLKAEGSIVGVAGVYQFTGKGYNTYKPRISAIRTLGTR